MKRSKHHLFQIARKEIVATSESQITASEDMKGIVHELERLTKELDKKLKSTSYN
ncbi:MAG: hypothetical protein ABFD18_05460 [Syntrophomonas sp.]